jgi:hypothetical protein
MKTNNFTEILTSNNQQMQEKFIEMANDCLNMIETDQININSAEDLMSIFINKAKVILLQFFGMILSDIQIENESKNVITKNGIKFRKIKNDTEITILTKHGNIKIYRDYYFSRIKSEGFGIIDDKIEIIQEHRMTKSMIEELTFVGQKEDCFEEGKNTIKRYLGLDISSKQIQKVSEEVGKEIFVQDVELADEIAINKEYRLSRTKNKSKEPISSMYVMADGSMLSLLGKANWKEIKLGLVIRDDEINVKYPNSENINITDKEYISYLGNKDEFKKVLYATAVKNGFVEGYTKVVCVADGASYLWNMFEELFPGCEKILDNYHFKENVSKFADWIFEGDELGKKSWINKIIDLSFENKSDEIIKEIKLTNYNKKNRPSNIPNLYLYVSERKDLINYGNFLEKGYIIGSGHIESAHKSVLQKRLKQSGMHWSKEGAQYIAALRTKYKSNLWHMVIYNINEVIYSKYSA